MALAERLIPSNTATAALRRIAFQLVDETDLITPEDITVTGVKVSLSIDGGTPADSTNDIVKVSGTTGLYYLELTQTEANQTAGVELWGTLAPTGCARTFLKATIAPANVFASGVAVSSIDAGAITASAIAADAITAAKIAADAVAEIQSGLATAAALTTVDNEIAALQATANAIEADTQDLQTQIGTNGAGLTAIGDTRLANLDAAVSTRATPAQVNAEVDTALADIHLDHLLATTYDPAAKPGAADALLNEMVENDGGVSRFTANALEQAPTGGSAPSAAAIRAEIDANSTQLAAIRADTEDLQAQVGTAGAGLTALGDTRLGNLDAAVSTRATPAEVASELATYDAPTKAELDAAVAPLATAAALTAVDTVVDAIQAKTDNLPAAPAATGDIPTAAQNADALLGRSIAGGADGGRTVTSALRRIRNRVAIAGGTMTVYREDDSTSDHTAAVTTSAGNPISEVDPT